MRLQKITQRDLLHNEQGLNRDFLFPELLDALTCVGVVEGEPKLLCCLIGPDLIASSRQARLLQGSKIGFYVGKYKLNAVISRAVANWGDLEVYRISNRVGDYGAKTCPIASTEQVGTEKRFMFVTGLQGEHCAVSLEVLRSVSSSSKGTLLGSYFSEAVTMQKQDTGAPAFILGPANELLYLGANCTPTPNEHKVTVAAPWLKEIEEFI